MARRPAALIPRSGDGRSGKILTRRVGETHLRDPQTKWRNRRFHFFDQQNANNANTTSAEKNLFATLYGQRTETQPKERHFRRAPDGVWHIQSPGFPNAKIMDAFERLNLKCLQLLFENADQFWNALESSDFNIIHAGLDPEALIGRDQFNETFRLLEDPLTQRLIYYYSVRHYNHVAQNIISHILISLGDVYALLSEENLYEDIPLELQSYRAGADYRNSISPSGHRIWSNINFCIEKTISFLDFTTKYVYELSSIKPGVVPRKSLARDITFGKWRHTRLAKDTPLSATSTELRLINALRDETVHNGTIDHFSRIYEQTFGAEVRGRFILLPDHEDGRILTAAGRKRFFRQDNHLNIVLPTMLDRVLADTLASLDIIDSRIEQKWSDLESYSNRHPEITNAMEIAEKTGAFMKYSQSDT